jgi:probable enterotoxin D
MDFWKESSTTNKIIIIVLMVLLIAICVFAVIYFLPTITGSADETPTPTTGIEGEGVIVPTPPPGLPYVTATTDVNIRTGPGKDFEVIGVLHEGQQAAVLALSDDGEWWAIRVEYPPDNIGWVSAEFTSVTGSALVIPTPAPGSPSVTATANVNIRNGPGLDYDVIGLLLIGHSAQVVGISGDSMWWAINLPEAQNGIGWVSAQYVTAENTEDVPVMGGEPTPTQAEATQTLSPEEIPEELPPTEEGTIIIPTPAPGLPAITATIDVNIRKGPSTNNEVIGLLNGGQSAQLKVLSDDGGWYGINVSYPPTNTGWVSADYAVLTGDLVEIPPAEEGQPSVSATANVNVRTGPGTTYEIITLFLIGNSTQVVGVSEDGLWWVINVPDAVNGQGWVSAGYVQAENTEGVPTIPAP